MDDYRTRRLTQLRADEAEARSYNIWYLTWLANFIRWWRHHGPLKDEI